MDSNYTAGSKPVSSSDVGELARDFSLLPAAVAKLAEDTVAAAQEILEGFREVYDWKWRGFLDMEMFIESVNQLRLPSWQQSFPKWFRDCKGHLKRFFAAELELQSQQSWHQNLSCCT